MAPDAIWFLLALAAAGLFAGFVGGLFGLGGGVVMVPALFAVFSALGVDDAVRMHVAIATSLSTIVSTAWRSLATHAKAGAVDFAILRSWGPWITLGALLGAAIAGSADTNVLLIVFGAGLFVSAAQMGFGRPDWRLFHELPRGVFGASIAAGIGVLSAMMGIGGGTFGVPVMTLSGVPIHRAVATASGFGAAIALPAALGYIVAGWGREGLPPWSLGFVSIPGFIILGVLTAITAPIGARLAHRLPQLALKRAFAALLALIALNMLREALS
jgi:uncharacterized membrane protein YfcA